MSKKIIVTFIIVLILFLIYNFSYATGITTNTIGTTNNAYANAIVDNSSYVNNITTNTINTNTINTNTLNNSSNNENTNRLTSSSSEYTTVSSLKSASQNEGLSFSNILSIILIAIGIVLILLGVAVLIKLKN